MKNQKQGFIVPLVIIIIAALAIGIALYVHSKSSQPAAVITSTTPISSTNPPPQNVINELGKMNDRVTYHPGTGSSFNIHARLQLLITQYPGLPAYINQYYSGLAQIMNVIVPNSQTASGTVTTQTK